MKILFYSDLHTEFDGFTPKKEWLNGVDLVVQVGDVNHAPSNIKLLKSWNAPVLFTPGNHDFWNTDIRTVHGSPYGWSGGEQEYYVICDRTWEQAGKDMREAAKGSNVTVMDNNTVVMDGVRFIGSTLWYRANELTRLDVALINDYRRIFSEKGKLITPEWVHEQHEKSVDFIQAELEKPFKGKTVLMTHHPAWLVPGVEDKQCPKAYGTDLEYLWKDKVDLLLHGHLHTAVNTYMGRTRVVCNPRGYPKEDTRRTFKKNFVITV